MSFDPLLCLLAMSPPSGQQDPKASMMQFVILMVGMVAMMYLLIIRPQRQQQKKLEELTKNVRSGDRIVTSSGIVGQVLTVRERTVTIRSNDAKMEVLK